jgi:integron integrase
MKNPTREKRAVLVPNPKARLFDQIREVMRFHHYSYRTEKTYSQWVRRYLAFHRQPDRSGPDSGWQHPRRMGAPEVASFLAHLAVAGNVAASTQNQALNALVFLYEQVLRIELGDLGEFARVTRPARLPEVLTQEQTRRVLAALKPGTSGLIIRLLYGTGMRVMECLRLRVKDLEFDRGRIVVREGKGDKDRLTIFPEALKGELQKHLERVKLLHEKDLAEGFGRVWLPHALARKFPNADREWVWQWVFPSALRSTDPRTGIVRRHHVNEMPIQRAMKAAFGWLASPNARLATRCAIVLRRTCWRAIATSERFRISSGTKMFPPR